MLGGWGRPALAESAVWNLHPLLVGVEAIRLLGLRVAAGDADEEGIVAELDGMDVADRERGRVPGLVHELALQGEVRVARPAAVVEPPPAPHAGRVLVVAVDHPARTVVVHRGLAAL